MAHSWKRSRRAYWLGALCVGASVFALAPTASAQTAAATRTENLQRFDIDAQPLSSALAAFARQAHLNALYADAVVAPYRAPALHGDFTASAALSILLSASPLHGEITAGGGLALADLGSGDGGGANADARGEDIVVTGSRIRGAAPAGANLITLDRAAIDATGRTSVQAVIQTLPQNFAGSQNETTQEGMRNTGSNYSFASTVNLRGLGADATLTLVNGRRLAPIGDGNFVDISGIPLSAVSRIEVLADGASATYGSDAVGGVVNIILNDNFTGAETSMHYGAASQGGAQEFGVSHLAGFAWPGGQLTAGYDYRRRGEVNVLDRAFTRSADFRDRGGDDFRSIYANPGNIIAIGDTPVELAIPHGQDGTSLSEADLIPGTENLGEINQLSWLLPRQTSNALFLSGHQDLTTHLHLFANAIASDRRAYSERTNLTTDLFVPETNAYRRLNNLFPGQGDLIVEYDMSNDLGPITTSSDTRSFSGVAGLDYDFANQWRLEGALAYARASEHVDINNFFDSVDDALASSDLATAFNPFADGSNTNAAVLAGLSFDQHEQSRASTLTTSFKADGPLLSLWAGPLRAAFGVEQRREDFESNRLEVHNSGTSEVESQPLAVRTVNAVYAELNAPLIGPENNFALARSLTLSLSARREDASDYGASTTPKAGFRWELVDGFALRGSWGLSFRGPNFRQLLSGVHETLVSIPAALDPFANDATTGLMVVLGSNRSLKPERAETWTAGFDLQPTWLPGFRASAAYFDIDFADRIAVPGNVFAILANPSGYESIVFRNPNADLVNSYLGLGAHSGSLAPANVEVILDLRNVNLSAQRVRGVDLSSSYTFATAVGDVDLNAAASLLFEHETTLVPGASAVSALDTVNGPLSLRTRFGVTWRDRAWSAGANVNYAGAYSDTISVPNRRIKSFTTFDARLSYALGGEAGDGGSEIALNVENLLDRDPPFVNNPVGYAYDPANASPLGRVVSLELRHRW